MRRDGASKKRESMPLADALQRAFHLRAAERHADLLRILRPLVERLPRHGQPQRVYHARALGPRSTRGVARHAPAQPAPHRIPRGRDRRRRSPRPARRTAPGARSLVRHGLRSGARSRCAGARVLAPRTLRREHRSVRPRARDAAQRGRTRAEGSGAGRAQRGPAPFVRGPGARRRAEKRASWCARARSRCTIHRGTWLQLGVVACSGDLRRRCVADRALRCSASAALEPRHRRRAYVARPHLPRSAVRRARSARCSAVTLAKQRATPAPLEATARFGGCCSTSTSPPRPSASARGAVDSRRIWRL